MTKLLLTGALAGVAAGLLGALCGVGGGIIMVPIFTAALGFTQKQAVATSMAVIIFTALAATLSNVRAAAQGGPALVNWPVFWSAAVCSAIASWFMSDFMRSLSDAVLTRVFAIFVMAAGAWMFATAQKKPPVAAAVSKE